MIDLDPSRKRKRFLAALLISATVSILCISLSMAGIFEPYELRTFDRMMGYLSMKTERPDIVIVEIDQGSLDSLQKVHISWPWPRQVYSPIIDFLSKAGAKAIFFDILITESSSYGKEDDIKFSESIMKAGNVYMPFFLSKNPGNWSVSEELFLKRYSVKANIAEGLQIDEFESVTLPIPEIIATSKGMGNVQIKPDPDGIYRKVPLFFNYRGAIFSHLGISYLVDRSNAPVIIGDGFINIDNHIIPLENGLFILKYYGGKGYYSNYNASQVIRASEDIKRGLTPELSPEQFRDKYVFIGLTAPGLYDLKPTPVSSVYPGVGIHATLLNNILRDDFLIRIDRKLLFLFIIAVSMASALIVIFTHSFAKNLIFLSLSIALLVITGILFYKSNLLLDQVSLLSSLIMSFAISSVFSYSTEGKQKRQIRQVFSYYMNETLVNEILKEPENLRLGGEKRVLTVFFSDLQDFTSLSEKRRPEDVVRFLNIYLTAMTEIILSRGGIIDKYQGDGIMAFWGAPVKKEDDEIHACLAALENQEKLQELRDIFRNMGFPSIYSRIGINTGEMIVGNMGSEKRFDYTVIGDNVNLASRLESANKLYSTKIIVSEPTYLKAKNHFEFRELDLIRVTGKEMQVRIYELMARKGELSEQGQKVRNLFIEGLSFYREKRCRDALERFLLCQKLIHNDGPSGEYIRRCNEIIKHPELTEWDSIYIMEGK